VSKGSTELYVSLATALLVTVFYLAMAQDGVPASSSLAGYGFGVVGFLLMLGAEVLYTWRKQKRGAGWGKLRTWLQAHIFLGLIGPYLVLLHSAWRLNGLAGVTMLLAMAMVASGFLVSYIYPALPRTNEGVELTLPELEVQIEGAHQALQAWAAGHPEAGAVLGRRLAALAQPPPSGGTLSVLGRVLLRWDHQRQIRRELDSLHGLGAAQARELGQLLDRRYWLETQAHSLAAARRLLGQSRAIHIVLGVVLFALAFVHIGVALYYATLAH
jgi:hypothetical protein